MTSTMPLDTEQQGGWPDEIFTGSIRRLELESIGGHRVAVDSGRWHGGLEGADRLVLSRCQGPVLDVGCGPGRHVAELTARGVLALGIDVSPAAVDETLRRGAPAVLASVFGVVPKEGWWESALLLDGNIGIGGHVESLLARTGQLLVPGGRILVER